MSLLLTMVIVISINAVSEGKILFAKNMNGEIISDSSKRKALPDSLSEFPSKSNVYPPRDRYRMPMAILPKDIDYKMKFYIPPDSIDYKMKILDYPDSANYRLHLKKFRVPKFPGQK